MSEVIDSPPRADRLVETLVGLGATHLVGIPDNGSAPLFDAERMEAAGLRVQTVTREGEAFAIASGLWLGGASPVVAIQNTGLLESGDALRGTAVRMGVPLLCLVGYRGYATMPRVPRPGSGADGSSELLTRADVDSAAVLTEPTLSAWRVPSFRLRTDEDLVRLEAAWERAAVEKRPVAVLLERGLSP